ncbi:hypothetical protein ACLBUO_32345, partial [Pseudomonas aeruginosa]
MRYWYLRLAVFLGALAVPAWWLYPPARIVKRLP